MGIFDEADGLLDALEGEKDDNDEDDIKSSSEIEDWAFAKAGEFCKKYVIPSRRDDASESLIKLMESAFAKGAKAREEAGL